MTKCDETYFIQYLIINTILYCSVESKDPHSNVDTPATNKDNSRSSSRTGQKKRKAVAVKGCDNGGPSEKKNRKMSNGFKKKENMSDKDNSSGSSLNRKKKRKNSVRSSNVRDRGGVTKSLFDDGEPSGKKNRKMNNEQGNTSASSNRDNSSGSGQIGQKKGKRSAGSSNVRDSQCQISSHGEPSGKKKRNISDGLANEQGNISVSSNQDNSSGMAQNGQNKGERSADSPNVKDSECEISSCSDGEEGREISACSPSQEHRCDESLGRRDEMTKETSAPVRRSSRIRHKTSSNEKQKEEFNKTKGHDKTKEEVAALTTADFSDDDTSDDAFRKNISGLVNKLRKEDEQPNSETDKTETGKEINVVTQPFPSNEHILQITDVHDPLMAVQIETGQMNHVSVAEIYRNCEMKDIPDFKFEQGKYVVLALDLEGNSDEPKKLIRTEIDSSKVQVVEQNRTEEREVNITVDDTNNENSDETQKSSKNSICNAIRVVDRETEDKQEGKATEQKSQGLNGTEENVKNENNDETQKLTHTEIDSSKDQVVDKETEDNKEWKATEQNVDEKVNQVVDNETEDNQEGKATEHNVDEKVNQVVDNETEDNQEGKATEHNVDEKVNQEVNGTDEEVKKGNNDETHKLIQTEIDSSKVQDNEEGKATEQTVDEKVNQEVNGTEEDLKNGNSDETQKLTHTEEINSIKVQETEDNQEGKATERNGTEEDVKNGNSDETQKLTHTKEINSIKVQETEDNQEGEATEQTVDEKVYQEVNGPEEGVKNGNSDETQKLTHTEEIDSSKVQEVQQETEDNQEVNTTKEKRQDVGEEDNQKEANAPNECRKDGDENACKVKMVRDAEVNNNGEDVREPRECCVKESADCENNGVLPEICGGQFEQDDKTTENAGFHQCGPDIDEDSEDGSEKRKTDSGDDEYINVVDTDVSENDGIFPTDSEYSRSPEEDSESNSDNSAIYFKQRSTHVLIKDPSARRRDESRGQYMCRLARHFKKNKYGCELPSRTFSNTHSLFRNDGHDEV